MEKKILCSNYPLSRKNYSTIIHSTRNRNVFIIVLEILYSVSMNKKSNGMSSKVKVIKKKKRKIYPIRPMKGKVTKFGTVQFVGRIEFCRSIFQTVLYSIDFNQSINIWCVIIIGINLRLGGLTPSFYWLYIESEQQELKAM